MNNKHTEGTWYAHDGQIYPEETGKTFAVIPHFDKENEEQQANARLIAAAPKLYEACEMALNVLTGTSYERKDGKTITNYDFFQYGMNAIATLKTALAEADRKENER